MPLPDRRRGAVHTARMRRTALVLTACLLATAACSDDPEPTSTGATSRPTTAPAGSSAPASEPSPSRARPAGAATPAAAFEADTSRDTAEPTGGPLSVTAIRVARQDGYDRVVFELDGREPGSPGWQVEYVEDPRRDGSGEPVDVAGEATLVVRVSGVGYPDDTGVEETRTAQVPRDTEVVREVEVGSVFEGVFEAFVGTSGEAPFRVFRLADPARVVVDVRHD